MGLPPSVSAARVVRSIAFLINLQSVGLCLLGCAAVAACERLQLSFALDISVVVFGVTFALTFTITQAYQRRERALTTLAELKASGLMASGSRQTAAAICCQQNSGGFDTTSSPLYPQTCAGLHHCPLLAPSVRGARKPLACLATLQPLQSSKRNFVPPVTRANPPAQPKRRRDWAQGPDYPASLGDGGAAWAHEFASVAVAYLSALQRYLAAVDGYEGVAEVRLAAKRNATAHLLWGDAVLQHEVLGDTFIERCAGGAA
jgi:hypothetical protein